MAATLQILRRRAPGCQARTQTARATAGATTKLSLNGPGQRSSNAAAPDPPTIAGQGIPRSQSAPAAVTAAAPVPRHVFRPGTRPLPPTRDAAGSARAPTSTPAAEAGGGNHPAMAYPKNSHAAPLSRRLSSGRKTGILSHIRWWTPGMEMRTASTARARTATATSVARRKSHEPRGTPSNTAAELT